jgi:hypothetical protein
LAQKQYLGLDGHARSKELDEQISLNVASLFSTDGGREVLRYLRSITIESVHGAAVSDAELRHMEGQRYIVGILESRINHAHRVKQND